MIERKKKKTSVPSPMARVRFPVWRWMRRTTVAF